MKNFYLISCSMIFRFGMRSMLNYYASCNVLDGRAVNEMSNGYRSSETNFFLIDLDNCEPDSLVQIEAIQQLDKSAKIIGFSKFHDKDLLVQQFKSGIHGLLSESCDFERLKLCIDTIHLGKEYFMRPASETILQHCLNADTELKGLVKMNGFNSRELEIIKLCCQQKTAKEIGKLIFVCEKTVDYHRQKIVEKMNVRNIVGLAVYAIKHNLVNLAEI